jgi:CubicO group peptidase (beta-lactamase class C family)
VYRLIPAEVYRRIRSGAPPPLVALRLLLHYPAATPASGDLRGSLALHHDQGRFGLSKVEATRKRAATGPITLDSIEAIETIVRGVVGEQRLTPGAALAVYANGQLALDLVIGYADTQRARLVDRDTRFPLFSGSKPIGAVALWQLIERGRLALDDRVVDIWPAFGQNGKDAVLVRHLLCHKGGFPMTPESLPRESWGDRARVNRVLEQLRPDYLPGSISAYHFQTQSWVIAELIRRIDGRDYQHYVQDEVFAPLELDRTHVVLPPELEDHCVKLHATDGTDSWGIQLIRSFHGLPLYRDMIPGTGLVSTAADMARFYAAIAGGGALGGARVLRGETVERMLDIAVLDEVDPSFGVAVRRCYGFELGGMDEPRRHSPGRTATARTIWHGGMSTSVCWGDRDTGLAFAYMSNGLRRDKFAAITRRDLSDAVRSTWSGANP